MNFFITPAFFNMSTSSASTTWDRLIRYHPIGSSKKVRWGDPILKDGQYDISKLAEQGQLQVNVLEGPSFLDAKPTGQTELVGKLLGPVTAQDVPIIRCIGLNYKTHSKTPYCPTFFAIVLTFAP